MLTETLLRVLFFVIDGCSAMSTQHWLPSLLPTGGFRYDFTWRLPVCTFKRKNRRFRFFEEGYCKDFQNY